MRKVGLVVVLVGTLAAIAVVLATAVQPGRSATHRGRAPRNAAVAFPLSITPLKAVFLPAPNLATKYSTTITERDHRAKVKITWFLILELIDPKGTPFPGLADSGAEYDPLCGNAKYPGGELNGSHPGYSAFVWHGKSNFVWYHGDVGSYSSPASYGCDHKSMGPRGHQGLVVIHVSDSRGWYCFARYYGTNDGTGEKPVCYKATAPRTPRSYVNLAIHLEREAIKELQTPAHSAKLWRDVVDDSMRELDHAIREVNEDKDTPPAEGAMEHLRNAKAHDGDALKPKTAVARIRDLEQGIEDKQGALKIIAAG
jgi:hypothetical protein